MAEQPRTEALDNPMSDSRAEDDIAAYAAWRRDPNRVTADDVNRRDRPTTEPLSSDVDELAWAYHQTRLRYPGGTLFCGDEHGNPFDFDSATCSCRLDMADVVEAYVRGPRLRAEAAQGAAPRAEGPRDHVTDLDNPLACWCGPYRDTEEPNVIIHRKGAEA